jgi:hypothetical protein
MADLHTVFLYYLQAQCSLTTSWMFVFLEHLTLEVANITRIGQGQMKVCFVISTSILVYISIKALSDEFLYLQAVLKTLNPPWHLVT